MRSVEQDVPEQVEKSVGRRDHENVQVYVLRIWRRQDFESCINMIAQHRYDGCQCVSALCMCHALRLAQFPNNVNVDLEVSQGSGQMIGENGIRGIRWRIQSTDPKAIHLPRWITQGIVKYPDFAVLAVGNFPEAQL